MTEIFVREKHVSDDSSDDVWDDTELIKAYDRAINDSKLKVAARLNKPRARKSTNMKWNIGTPCRATYDVDGLEYEATVDTVIDDHYVVVKFIGYENSQNINKNALKPSLGPLARQQQQDEAAQSQDNEMDTKDHRDFVPRESVRSRGMPHVHGAGIPLFSNGFCMEPAFPPPPPLPPKFSKHMNSQEQEAMNAMLMSWYMSGYYTGYYQAQRDKNSKNHLT